MTLTHMHDDDRKTGRASLSFRNLRMYLLLNLLTLTIWICIFRIIVTCEPYSDVSTTAFTNLSMICSLVASQQFADSSPKAAPGPKMFRKLLAFPYIIAVSGRSFTVRVCLASGIRGIYRREVSKSSLVLSSYIDHYPPTPLPLRFPRSTLSPLASAGRKCHKICSYHCWKVFSSTLTKHNQFDEGL